MSFRPSVISARKWLERAATGPQLFILSIQVARALMLAAFLFISTRMLGPANYGLIATTFAIATIGATIVGLGSGIGLVRDTSRDPAIFAKTWGQCLAKYLASGVIASAFFVTGAIAYLSDSVSILAIVLICITEMIISPLCMACGYAFLSHARYKTSAFVQLTPVIGRLSGISALLLLAPKISMDGYAQAVMAGTLASLAFIAILATMSIPKPSFSMLERTFKPDYSWLYVGSNIINSAAAETDKAFVLELSSPTETGTYTASTRIASAFAMPFGALLQSRSHYLFSLGKGFRPEHKAFMQRYGRMFILYGAACIAASLAISHHLANALGAGFQQVSSLLVVASLWVPANGMRQLCGSILTATDNVRLRVSSDILAFGFFIASAIALIPTHDAFGAAVAFVVSEVAGATISLLLCLRKFGSSS